MSGRLFIVGTPIGNLGDITARALEALRGASHVFAEDTRRSRALLTHFGIEGKKVLSLHAHSSERALEVALEVLEAGQDAALVSDAGMPTVSDPGAELVRRARKRGIVVEVVPGPSAVTAAVALSGLVLGPFTFLGFLPRKGSQRRLLLRTLAGSTMPTVVFESAQRLDRTLRDLELCCGGERQVAICRELTKQFEETLVAPLAELLQLDRQWRGEVTLVVAANPNARPEPTETDLNQRIAALLRGGASPRDATTQLSGELTASGERVRRKDLYARVLLMSEQRQADGQDADPGDEDEHDDDDDHENGQSGDEPDQDEHDDDARAAGRNGPRDRGQ
jgi:16S rRNA (cytidine1402-2'-O)-methyltransferase